jgi:hypothetical protein
MLTTERVFYARWILANGWAARPSPVDLDARDGCRRRPGLDPGHGARHDHGARW